MHISVTCPGCDRRYQLDPALRGLRTRCPNPLCRKVFEVREDAPAGGEPAATAAPEPAGDASRPPADRNVPRDPTAKPAVTQVVGDVGSLLPLMSAEAVEEPPPVRSRPAGRRVEEVIPVLPTSAGPAAPEPAPAGPSVKEVRWTDQSAPPVRDAQAPPARPAPADDLPTVRSGDSSRVKKLKPKSTPELPEIPPAPPVRGPRAESASPQPPTPPKPSARPVNPRARNAWMAGAGVVVLLLLIAVPAGWAYVGWLRSEQHRDAQALEAYQHGSFVRAAEQFRDLAADYGSGPHAGRYSFLADLSVARSLIETSGADPDAAQAKLLPLKEVADKDERLREFQADLETASARIVDLHFDRARQGLSRKTLAAAEKAVAEVVRVFPSNSADRVKAVVADLVARLDRQDRHDALMARLAEVIGLPSAAGVEFAHDLVRRAAREDHGLAGDPDVKSRLAEIDASLVTMVRYETATTDKPAPPRPAPPPSVRVVPALPTAHQATGARGAAGAGDRSVFALARGVLYAADPQTGDVRWTCRVGIDATALPVPCPDAPDVVLVSSADDRTLSARSARDGSVRWERALTSVCLGRPVVIGGRAYVVATEGRVLEVDLATGEILGSYDLGGQPLAAGAAVPAGTTQILVPARKRFVYALETDPEARTRKACLGVLRTDHPAGSLPGGLVTVRADPTDFLVLNQLDVARTGTNSTVIRVFRLPFQGMDEAAVVPERRVPGLSWFPPYFDGESMAFATDSGRFGLFGLRQPKTDDDPVFAELPDEARQLTSGQPPAGGCRPGSLVIRSADPDEWWVLAGGTLRRVHLDRFRQRLVTRWETPGLGTPVHEAQSSADGETIVVVTEPESGVSTVVMTAVDAGIGRVRWQRQLGVVCQGTPIRLGDELFALSRDGAVYRFSPPAAGEPAKAPAWLDAGQRVAAPADGRPVTPPVWIRGPGATALSVACVESGRNHRLVLRRVRAGQPGAEKLPEIVLLEPPGGTPALVGDALILPLAGGTLRRQPLNGSASTGGPDWLAHGADVGATGFVVALPENEFLTTDGRHGLTRWRWPAGEAVWQEMARAAHRGGRIVSAPVVVTENEATPRLAVPDAGGVTLYDLNLKPVRRWDHLGPVTAGPFRRDLPPAAPAPEAAEKPAENRLGWLVGGTSLVWVDPSLDKPLAVYDFGRTIVGEPDLVGRHLAVAGTDGFYALVDPDKGMAIAPGYQLAGSAVPVTTPVAWGPGQIFAPLSDGTALVLPASRLGPEIGPDRR